MSSYINRRLTGQQKNNRGIQSLILGLYTKLLKIMLSLSINNYNETAVKLYGQLFTSNQKLLFASRTVSKVTINVLTVTLFSQRSLWRLNVFGFLKSYLSYCYDETNKALSHLSCVPVKISLPSTSIPYSEMCPIKGLTNWNSLTVEELEEDTDCNWRVCKYGLC